MHGGRRTAGERCDRAGGASAANTRRDCRRRRGEGSYASTRNGAQHDGTAVMTVTTLTYRRYFAVLFPAPGGNSDRRAGETHRTEQYVTGAL